MTYRELVYLILDEIKLSGDDSYFTEDHVIFLLDKYRAFVLKQKYSDIKKLIPDSNYQTICLTLHEPPVDNYCVEGGMLRSKEKVPFIMPLGNTKLYTVNYFTRDIIYTNRDRFKYTGNNKYLKNLIYATIGPDNYVYLKSSNPQFLYLKKIKMTAIFQDSKEAAELSCNEECNNNCDILDNEFPIESALVAPLVELVLKELLGAAYRPKDTTNNAQDDLVDLISYIRRNMKSNLQKQIENE